MSNGYYRDNSRQVFDNRGNYAGTEYSKVFVDIPPTRRDDNNIVIYGSSGGSANCERDCEQDCPKATFVILEIGILIFDLVLGLIDIGEHKNSSICLLIFFVINAIAFIVGLCVDKKSIVFSRIFYFVFVLAFFNFAIYFAVCNNQDMKTSIILFALGSFWVGWWIFYHCIKFYCNNNCCCKGDDCI
jgi:hypothetical protein